MRDNIAAHFRRRVTVKRRVGSRLIEIELIASQLSLEINSVPKENLVKKLASYAANEPLHEGMGNRRVGNRFDFVYLENTEVC